MPPSTTQKRWENVINQTLHVIVFGGLAVLSPELSAIGIIVYELSPWHIKIGPLKIGQWPPGNPFRLPHGWLDEEGDRVVTPMRNVNDLRWDLVFELAGLAIGAAIGRLI